MRPVECRKHTVSLNPTSSVPMSSLSSIGRLGGGHVSPQSALSLACNFLLAAAIGDLQSGSLREAVAVGRPAHYMSQHRAQRRRPVNTVNLCWGGLSKWKGTCGMEVGEGFRVLGSNGRANAQHIEVRNRTLTPGCREYSATVNTVHTHGWENVQNSMLGKEGPRKAGRNAGEETWHAVWRR